jgi:cobalt-zinc-cadmium efflux system protein
MAHDHAHHHYVPPPHQEGSETRLIISIALNLLITIAEVVGGIISGSLALLSDAVHNFSDTASLGISLGARRIARRDPNRRKTFGYRRAELIGAFVNLVTLVLIAFFLMKKAVERFLDPQPIDGTVMLVVAVIGLAANLITAWLLHRDVEGSLNIQSAFVHIVSDALSSVGVVLGGVLIMAYDVYLVDPILTFAIACYILYHSYAMLRRTIDILMEGAPPDLRLPDLMSAVESMDPVVDMHHVHVWQIDEQTTALEAHIAIEKSDLAQMESLKRAIKERLHNDFGIGHSTLEFEFIPCHDPAIKNCFGQEAVTPHTAR